MNYTINIIMLFCAIIPLGGMKMNFIGIDIGSTASKVAVRGVDSLEFVLPSGWNSKETAMKIQSVLDEEYNIPIDENVKVISTGYGRVSVPYSDTSITEITCHAKGAVVIYGIEDLTVVDVGGQDTKVISIKGGYVNDFIMNDKCSAGTGRFLEIMANRLGITLDELFSSALEGEILKISSMCTVFAESEIISLMGTGEKREDIAAGIVDSVVQKVVQLAERQGIENNIALTGGLACNPNFVKALSTKIGKEVLAEPIAQFAGAIGASTIGLEKYKKRGTL